MQSKRVKLIDLMRHGTCEGGEIFRGTTDVKLSDAGWQQMRETSAGQGGWQRIISSPLLRCSEFARELAEQRNIPLHIDEQWREISFGEWEGQTIESVWASQGEVISQYFSEPGSVTPKGGEPVGDALARVVKAWQNLITSAQDEHILVIHHGGLLKLLLTYLLDAPLTSINRFEVSYAALTRIRIDWYEGQPHARLVQHYPGVGR